MKEKKGWREKLKAAAGKALEAAVEGKKKLPSIIDKGQKAYETAVKVQDWAGEHGIDLKGVYENASNGTVTIPEAVINEYLEKSIRESDIDVVSVKCLEGHMEIVVTGKKFVGTYEAVADMKFVESSINRENRVIELELLGDLQVKGKTLIARVLMATTAFILRALFGRSLVELDALESEFVSVEDRTIRVDLDRIEKLRPVLSGQLKRLAIFDLLVIKGIREVPGALEVSVELGPLGRLAAHGIATGKAVWEKRKGGEE
jgi:hypothetical protein